MFTLKSTVIFLCLFLTSCGYQPLYTAIKSDMKEVSIGEVKMRKVFHKVGERRVAQTVYKKLSEVFKGSGVYIINVDILESVSSLAIRRDATEQRSELNLTGYVKINNSDKTVFETTLRASVAYNVETTPYATDAGRERAKSSASLALSEEIVRIVSLYFRQKDL